MPFASLAAELHKEATRTPDDSPDLDTGDDSAPLDRPAILAEAPQHPWRIKGPILFLSLFLAFGSDYAASVVSPLKSALKKELGINNAQYAVVRPPPCFGR